MKQIIVDVRGAAYHDQDAPICGSSVPAMKQEVFPYVGFRLVHDDALRATCGGTWGFTPHFAASAFLDLSSPNLYLGNLGFRLVVDWREK